MTQTQRPEADSWRDLDPWDKARLRWRLRTDLHPEDPRPNQLTPAGDWLVWLLLAGRGWGKTRVGAEDVSDYARTHPGHRIAVVAATYEDARDVCIEGNSGLISVVPPEVIQSWNRSLGELVFTNGARVDLYSAEKPGSLRGPQHHRAWCDELAKWRYLETWDQLMFGLRLGVNPQCVVTTTPKPLALLDDLRSRPTTIPTTGSTFENARNLSPAALAELRTRYEGTQLGRQELYAELLADFDGALWQRAMIHEIAPAQLPPLVRVAVGVDPSTWGPEAGLEYETTGQGIETGIVVVGISADAQCYVLSDHSLRASPNDWAKEAIKAYRDNRANLMVPERNVGPWVVSIIRSAAEGGEPVMFFSKNGRPGVHASEGKRARAEPVAALYEQGKVHHVGRFPELEDSMCTWDPRESWSPDRLDALVWAVTALNPWAPTSSGISSAAGAAAGHVQR